MAKGKQAFYYEGPQPGETEQERAKRIEQQRWRRTRWELERIKRNVENLQVGSHDNLRRFNPTHLWFSAKLKTYSYKDSSKQHRLLTLSLPLIKPVTVMNLDLPKIPGGDIFHVQDEEGQTWPFEHLPSDIIPIEMAGNDQRFADFVLNFLW